VAKAVKFTEVPMQQGLIEAVMEMEAGCIGLTTMEMALDVAGFEIAQESPDVSWQVITSPLFGEYVYVELLMPVFTPLTFH
jgi:hypothetical protein